MSDESEAIAHICQLLVNVALLARCEIWLPDIQGELQASIQSIMHTVPDATIVKWSFDKRQVAGARYRHAARRTL